jgi:hypothetical protein
LNDQVVIVNQMKKDLNACPAMVAREKAKADAIIAQEKAKADAIIAQEKAKADAIEKAKALKLA